MTAPETTYLAQLIRAFVAGNPQPPDPLQELDWQALARLVADHGLATTLCDLLLNAPAPEEIKSGLDQQRRQLHRRHALLWMEVSRLLSTLEAEGIECVLLKGMALGRTVYPRPEDRVFSDVDLLVRRDYLEATCRILKPHYRPAKTRNHPIYYERFHFHRILSGPAGVTVELHWDLSRPEDYFRFDLEAFFERSVRVDDPSGTVIRVPCGVDQLLHAACQAVLSGYGDLRRVVDAAMLIKAGQAESSRLARLARRQGMATPLWVLMGLQAALAGGRFPEALEEALAPRALVRRCFDALDLPSVALERAAASHAGLREWLYALSAPDAGHGLAAIRRYVFPGVGQLLGAGSDPEHLPGLVSRGDFALRRGWFLAQTLGYQALRFAHRGPRMNEMERDARNS